jgi:DUF2961 family protein
MKHILFIAALGLSCVVGASAQMVTVSDTLSNPDASTFNGTIHVSWDKAFSYHGHTEQPGSMDVFVINGVLNVSLWPSDRISGGLTYAVTGQYNTGVSYIDFWYVTYSATPRTLAQVHLVSGASGIVPTGTPSVGQVPTATSSTAAMWQTPATPGDILSEAKPSGTAGYSSLKNASVANNATQTLVSLTGQSGGYISYIWMAVAAQDTTSNLTITADGNTVFNDRWVLFFGAEYQNNQASFMSRFIGATNNDSNNVSVYAFIPIPFSTSISVTYTNTSGSTETCFYIVQYQTGVPNTWTNTRRLRTSSGTISAATAQSVQTLLNATSLPQGRLLGIAFSIDSFPGSANPSTAPLEGEFKIYLDGASSPNYASSGTEDYAGMSNYFQGYTTTNANTSGIYSFSPYQGMTIKSTYTWNAFHFHIMDQLTFANAIKMTWDVGESNVSFTGTVRFAYCIWYYTQ